MRYAHFRAADGNVVLVEVRRRRRINSRVVFEDGHDDLVPNDQLTEVAPPQLQIPGARPDRVVPITPLRRLYQDLCELLSSGTQNQPAWGG